MAGLLDGRRRTQARQVALVMVAGGCGPVVGQPDAAESGTTVDTSDSATTSTATDTTPTAGTNTTSTSTSTPSTIGEESEASTAAWPGLPDLGPPHDCDVWEQNCPAGQKCFAFGWDEESPWNATRCWPVADDPGQLGDPCTVEESWFSGLDDCDFGLMCFFVDAATLTGTCLQQCGGSRSDPTCALPDTSCLIANEAPLAICLPSCDPLDQACGDDATCVASGSEFVCMRVAGDGGAYGEPCEYINDCDAGMLCATGQFAVGCEALDCCVPFCDLGVEEPDLACPQQELGERCVALFDDPTSEHADVGACGIPPE